MAVDSDGLPIVRMSVGDGVEMRLSPNGLWEIREVAAAECACHREIRARIRCCPAAHPAESSMLHAHAKKTEVAEVAAAITRLERDMASAVAMGETALAAKVEAEAKVAVALEMVAEADARRRALEEALEAERLKVETLKW